MDDPRAVDRSAAAQANGTDGDGGWDAEPAADDALAPSDPQTAAADAGRAAGATSEADASSDADSDAGRADAATSEADECPVAIGWPEGWIDALTGADGPLLWDRTLERELARVKRYHRPATVAFMELEGLDRVARRWGLDAAEDALRGCARILQGELRTSDHFARIEPARFGILLTETAEIAAINFIERARVACEHEVRASGEELSIGFGWASPSGEGTLADAVEKAVTRLEAELGRR
jgi:diguanylate cyclase (GGDEF)-like protein